MANKMTKTRWERDELQFPRLLAEIRAIGLMPKQYRELKESMDLERDEIDELFERAETLWLYGATQVRF